MLRGEGTTTDVLRSKLWVRSIPFIKGKGPSEDFLTFVKGREGMISAIEKVDMVSLELSITCGPDLAARLIELAVTRE